MLVTDVADLPDDTDVLIAGGGPAGLSLALELTRNGIACVVVDPRVDLSVQPGAKLCNMRTMELLRRWGLADAVRAAGELPAGFPTDVKFVPDLAGPVLATIPDALTAGGADIRSIAEPGLQIPQYRLEEVLAREVAAAPLCTFLRGARVDLADQNATGVRAQVSDEGGATRQIGARWLAGCDGGSSSVRRAIGGRMSGRAPSAMNLAIVFDSDDVDVLERLGPAVHYWTVGLTPNGLFGPVDARRRWWMHLHGFPPGTRADELDVPALVQQTLGRPTVVELVDVSPWNTHALVADRYRVGHALLLGDAAHLHPPTGGYGMNMAIGDAVDVGWKLAAVLHGRAGETLLDTYEQERRPVHEFTINEAITNYQQMQRALADMGPLDGDLLRADGPAADRLRAAVGEAVVRVKEREFASAGLQLGFSYAGSSLISAEKQESPEDWEVTKYSPTARPGHRLPHATLSDGTALLDHLTGFTLIGTRRTPEAVAGVEALRDDAAASDVPLQVVEAYDPALRVRLGADLVLVRPDTIVAWRGSGAEPELPLVLARAHGDRDAAVAQAVPA